MSRYKALRSIRDRLAHRESLLRWGAEFLDLEECSPNYQLSFKNAWKVNTISYHLSAIHLMLHYDDYASNYQAIEHGSLRKLKDSIENMKKYSNTCPGDKGYLDVCYLQHEMSLSKRNRTFYYMGLLAHAAVCGQKIMVEELIRSKASKDLLDISFC